MARKTALAKLKTKYRAKRRAATKSARSSIAKAKASPIPDLKFLNAEGRAKAKAAHASSLAALKQSAAARIEAIRDAERLATDDLKRVQHEVAKLLPAKRRAPVKQIDVDRGNAIITAMTKRPGIKSQYPSMKDAKAAAKAGHQGFWSYTSYNNSQYRRSFEYARKLPIFSYSIAIQTGDERKTLFGLQKLYEDGDIKEDIVFPVDGILFGGKYKPLENPERIAYYWQLNRAFMKKHNPTSVYWKNHVG